MTRQTGAKIPTNVTELRDDLCRMYYEIGEGMVKFLMAKEKSNAAGKIIKSVGVQLEYAKLRKEAPNIPFVR